MNIRALLNTLSSSVHSLPLVILYVTEGCNLRCVTCSYRKPVPGELTLDEIRSLAVELKRFGLRHIVFSGGEPLLRRDLPEICSIFRALGVHQTLLTNGLLLEKRIGEVREFFREIIVSLDGPSPEVHDAIRGVESFATILAGIRSVLALPARPRLSVRTVVQKKNFRCLPDMVRLARELGVDRISFLAADVLSDSFGRDTRGVAAPAQSIALTAEEAKEFRLLVDRLIIECRDDFASGLLPGAPRTLLHIVEYFEALAGGRAYPENRCNAPMVSAVITSTGELQPCYFLPRFGNLRDGALTEALNGNAIRETRRNVRHRTLERCRTCVCTLNVRPVRALLDRF